MRLMTIVFSGMLYFICLTYLDDIIIFGATFEEHLNRLEQALKLLKTANLKLKPSKCAFGKKSVSFWAILSGKKELAQTLKNSNKFKSGHALEYKTTCVVYLGMQRIIDSSSKNLHT